MAIPICAKVRHPLSVKLGACAIIAAFSVITPTPAPAQDCQWECAKCTCNLQTGDCVCSDCTLKCSQ
jgi:hypothetical protein